MGTNELPVDAAPPLRRGRLLDRRRLARLAGVGAAQAAVQALGFLAGLVLVRAMAPVEYGHYTLALSLVGVGSVLGDLGLATAVMARGGQSAAAGPLGPLFADAAALQRRLALIAIGALGPVALAVLLRLDLNVPEAALLAALVAVTAALQLRAGLALALVRLLGHVGFQQRLDLAVNASRLALVAALSVAALDAGLACAVQALAALATGLVLHAHLRPLLAVPAVPPGTHAAALRDQVRRQAPNSLYYLASSQIVVWLVGLFGSSERVAEVGALGRLAALFALLGAISASLVLPWFSRQRDVAELRAGLRSVHAFHAALLVTLLAFALALPDALLWLLGPHYAGLRAELPWVVASAALAAWAGWLHGIGCARGWVLPLGLGAGAGLLATLGAAVVVDLATVRGAFVVNAAVAGAGVVVAMAYLERRLREAAPT